MNEKQMRILLIKFQEWQLNNNILNANCAHNAAANMFIEKHQDENFLIIDKEVTLRRGISKKDIVQISKLSFFPDTFIAENEVQVVDDNGEVNDELTETLDELARINKRRRIIKEKF